MSFIFVPESEWPYECPFCQKRFQAKGDLPKHFFTSKHRGDPRIPIFGSPEWSDLLNRCTVFQRQFNPKRRRTRRKNTGTAISGPVSGADIDANDAGIAVVDNLSEVQHPAEDSILPDNDSDDTGPGAASNFSVRSILAPQTSDTGTLAIFFKCEPEPEDTGEAIL